MADQLDWEGRMERRASAAPGAYVPPAPMSPGGDPFGRRSSRYEGVEVNPAAVGTLYVPPPMSPQQIRAAQPGRFGDKVEAPVQVTAAHLAAPPTTMVKAEEHAVEEERRASDHARSQAGYHSMRRG